MKTTMTLTMKTIPLLSPAARRWAASPWLALALVLCPVMAEARLMPSRASVEVGMVANSTELTTAEKIARLREFMAAEETRQTAYYHLDTLDAAAAKAGALAIFRAEATPRLTKLWAGHVLLARVRTGDEGFVKEFNAEFAKYLIAAILDGGEAEFFAKQDGSDPTAVGEYAWLASDFGGYQGIDFAPYRDARLVPVLVRCLEAPDHVYSANQGCVVRGEAGEPSGRNTARQQVPIALGRLGDARAIAPLEKVLFSPAPVPVPANAPAGALGDVYLRMNAAEGLARLLEKKEDRAELGRKLLEKDDKALVWCRLPYAKGMIAAGDDGGVAFLSLKHAGVTPEQLADPNQITHHLQERLKVLQGFKSARVEDFVGELLGYEPWRKLVLFTPGSVKAEVVLAVTPPADDAAALELCAPRIIETQRMLLACVTENRMTALAGKLQAIAKDSRNETIRRMTEECLKGIGE